MPKKSSKQTVKGKRAKTFQIHAKYLSELRGVDGVNITLMEIDKETENIKVTMQGDDLNFDEITKAIEEYGGSIHSVDEVVAGSKLIEEVTTPQD